MTTVDATSPQGLAALEAVRREQARRLAWVVVTFVVLPTAVAGIYYGAIASPEYTARATFSVDTADGGPPGPNIPQPGTDVARDALFVREYLLSRNAFETLNDEHGFRETYSGSSIDRLSRLDPKATNNGAYEYFRDHVFVDFDSSTGFLRLEVRTFSAPDASRFAEALLSMGEAKVRAINDGIREDAIASAQSSVNAARAELARAEGALEEARAAGEAAALEQAVADRASAARRLEDATGTLDELRDLRARALQHFVRIVEPTVPERPSGPKVWREVLAWALGTLACLVIGSILVATAREHAM
jgi:capsular polysaccharide transport system permease protein